MHFYKVLDHCIKLTNVKKKTIVVQDKLDVYYFYKSENLNFYISRVFTKNNLCFGKNHKMGVCQMYKKNKPAGIYSPSLVMNF